MTPRENTALLHLRRLPVHLPRRTPSNPEANRSIVDDQPRKPLLVLDCLTVDSPLFAHAARRTPWVKDGSRGLLRFRLKVAGIGVIGLLIVTALDLPGRQAAALLRSDPTYPLLDSLQVGALAILGVSIVVSGISDVTPALAAAGGWIKSAALWELLRVSPLARREIVFGQMAVLRLRGCRLMTVTTILRLTGIFVFVAAAALEALNQLMIRFEPTSVGSVLIILVFATETVIALTYVLAVEPGWRLSLHAALAVALAVRFRTESLRLVANLLIIIGVWMLTPVFLALATVVGLILPFLAPITVPFMWYFWLKGMYRYIENASLNAATMRIFLEAAGDEGLAL